MTTFLEIAGFVVVVGIFVYTQFLRPRAASMVSVDAALDDVLGRYGLVRAASTDVAGTELLRVYEGVYAGRRLRFTLAVSFFKLFLRRRRPGGRFAAERFSRHVEGDRHHHAIANRFDYDIGEGKSLGLQLTSRHLAEAENGKRDARIGLRYHVQERYEESSAGDRAIDDAFIVRASEPALARMVLANAELRAELMRLQGVNIIVDGNRILLDDLWTSGTHQEIRDWPSWEERVGSVMRTLSHLANAVESS